jgi:hypothetical protein
LHVFQNLLFWLFFLLLKLSQVWNSNDLKMCKSGSAFTMFRCLPSHKLHYFTYFTSMNISYLFFFYTVTCTNRFHPCSITVGTLNRFGTWLWAWPTTLWTCINHINVNIFVNANCCLSEFQVHYNL